MGKASKVPDVLRWLDERGRNSASFGSHADAYEIAAQKLREAMEADAALASSPPAETWTEEQIQRAYSAYRKHDGDCLSSLRAAIATLSVAPPAETEEGGALVREVMKTALCVLSAAEHAQSWSAPFAKDIAMAREGIIAALSRGEADPPCTDCGGSGVSYQTERRCSCRPEAGAPSREAIAAFLKGRDEALGPVGPEHTDEERLESADAILSLFSPQSLKASEKKEDHIARAVPQSAIGGEDYYPSHEALHDLVNLLSEHDALNGGGPGWGERWKKAVIHAEELVRVEP